MESIEKSEAHADASVSVHDSKVKNQTKEGNPVAEKEWICVGHESTFGTRTALRVHRRQVTVLRVKRRKLQHGASTSANSSSGSQTKTEKWMCLDSICYHAGGPLMQGNIQQIGDRTCISCPWHSYLIDVVTGEGLYLDMSRRYCSKGVRQRVHDIKLEENDHVYVRLSTNGEIGSDEYAYIGRNYANGAEIPTKCFPDW